jgi:predicted ArsR family transcriptional regulator
MKKLEDLLKSAQRPSKPLRDRLLDRLASVGGWASLSELNAPTAAGFTAAQIRAELEKLWNEGVIDAEAYRPAHGRPGLRFRLAGGIER